MNSNYEWSPRPPTVRQRIVAGVFLIMLVAAIASDFADLRLFGAYDKQAVGILLIVWLILLTRFMPTARRK